MNNGNHFVKIVVFIMIQICISFLACTEDKAMGEWLGNKVGITENVPEPWSNIVVNNNKVKIWGREYTFGGNGLPSGINVLGNELLSMPINLKMEVNGQHANTEAGKLLNKLQKSNKVVLTSSSNTNNVNIETTVEIEYDGLMVFNFSVKPLNGPVIINSLQIEIPIRKELVTLFSHHYLLTEDPFKTAAENDFGGGSLPTHDWTSPFTPLVWLGNERMGLQWFAENTEGWAIRNNDQVIAIKQDNKSVLLQINVIDKDKKINKEHNFRFGLIATPVKPLPSYEKYSTFSTTQAASAIQALKWVKPRDNTTPLDEAIKRGLKMVVIHQLWTELQGYPGTLRAENDAALRKFMKEAHKRGLKVILYVGREISMACPEWSSWGEKMIMKPNKLGVKRSDPPAKAFRPDANKYYTDFLCFKIKTLIQEYDIDGVMLDGHGNIMPCENLEHGHGYKDSAGKIHPTYAILETRDLLKRLYGIFHGLEKKDGIVLAHVGSPFVPSLNFSDFRWAGEGVIRTFNKAYWKNVGGMPGRAVAEKLTSGLTLDEFRACYMSFPFGVPIVYMPKTKDVSTPASETAAITLIHDVMPRFKWIDVGKGDEISGEKEESELWNVWKLRKDFGCDDAVFYPYWVEQKYIHYSPADAVKISFFRKRNGEMLLFLANTDIRKQVVSIGFDPKLPGGKLPYKTSHGNAASFDGRNLSISIDSKNFEVISIKAGD